MFGFSHLWTLSLSPSLSVFSPSPHSPLQKYKLTKVDTVMLPATPPGLKLISINFYIILVAEG